MFKISDLDLKYKYNTKHDVGDDPKKIGHPDKDELDRNEAYEMVDYINHLLKSWSWNPPLTEKDHLPVGKKIERLIKDHVPKDVHSKVKHIGPWLLANWSKY